MQPSPGVNSRCRGEIDSCPWENYWLHPTGCGVTTLQSEHDSEMMHYVLSHDTSRDVTWYTMWCHVMSHDTSCTVTCHVMSHVMWCHMIHHVLSHDTSCTVTCHVMSHDTSCAVTYVITWHASQVFCISQSLPQLPLQIEDAMRPETSEVYSTLYTHSQVLMNIHILIRTVPRAGWTKTLVWTIGSLTSG